jgi:amino acid adenylation domain-containing protein
MKVADNLQDKLVCEYWQNKLLQKAVSTQTGTKEFAQDKSGYSMTRELLDPATSREIKELCNNNPLAEFTFLMSVYMLVLHKYFGLAEVMVATGDLNHAAGAIGEDHILFYEITDFEKLTAKAFIKEVQSEVQNVLRYRQFDPAELNSTFKNHGRSIEQLIRYAFAYSQTNFSSGFLDNADMKISVEAHKHAFEVQLYYREDTYSAAFAKQFLSHYAYILKDIRSALNTGVQKISLLSPEEQKSLTHKNGNTWPVAEQSETVIGLFEKKARLFPDHTALVAGGKAWTYKELNEKCNQVAHHLLTEYKVQPEEPIGLMVHNSEWMAIGMLSILKAGAAYVPIEPDQPVQRRNHIIRDTGLKVIITQFDLVFGISDFNGNVFAADLQADTLTTPVTNPGVPLNGKNLAYIIYTSGTTGASKGVMIENHSLVNYASWFIQTFDINENDSALLSSSYAFDLGYTNIWGALLSGAALHLLDVDIKKSADQILRYMVKQKLSFIKTTPSLFYMIVHHPEFGKLSAGLQLRLIVLGGEPISADDVALYLETHPSTTFVNHYGPTETTVGTVAHRIIDIEEYRKQPVIGKAITNSEAFIVDESGNLVPKGITGELCIAGVGMARGYLNQPKLTQEKFIENPFSPGQLMYKTGDLAKRSPENDNIILLGRKDSQVKIRGYRVELGEITNTIKKHSDIEQAIVVLKTGQQSGNYLVAYYTTHNKTEVARLRSFLEDYLPAYMIPAHFVLLRSMPVTSNGKVDTKALPDPEQASTETFQPPVTETQKAIAAIWQEVLGIKQVGINHNFFDLGGHSLKATQVLTAIHQQLSDKIKLTDLFDHPVLADLAAVIADADNTVNETIPSAEEQEHYPISYAQRRLWLIEQFEEAKSAYNVHNSFVFDVLNLAAFDKTIQALLEQHEILRTSFCMVDGEPRQRVLFLSEFNFVVNYVDLRSSDNQEQAITQIVREERNRQMNLEQDTLLRITLLQLEEEKYQAEINIHHIIFDGWSKKNLFSEFNKLYDHFNGSAGTSVTEKKLQYRDYAVWQNQQLESGAWEEHKNYWHDQFSGQIPLLEFPSDFPRPVMKQYQGSGITFLLNKEKTDALYNLCNKLDATIFMGLLTLVKSLLHRYTGQEDIVIGSPIAGRDRKELEDQLGFYVNTLALRTQLHGEITFRELLDLVKKTAINAYSHQAYPFDLLLDELKLNRDMSRTPLFDVMVLLQNITGPEEYDLTSGENEQKLVVTPDEVSKFDLTFTFRETNNGILAHLTFNTSLYEEDRMRRMVKHLEYLLQAVTNAPDKPIGVLHYLDKAEHQLLSNKFNDTEINYPSKATIQKLFEQRVAEQPDAIAVISGERNVTYRELNEKANQLAHYLRRHYSLRRDTLVGLMVERSEWMIIGIMGILKAGAAYVPVDPEYPADRKAYLLQDSSVSLLITDDELTFSGEFSGKKIYLRSQWDIISAGMPVTNGVIENEPHDLAYVIYTSGSSGLPKGVLIEHQNVVRLLFNEQFQFDFSANDTWTVFHSMCFDFSVWEIFGSLLYGGKLVIVPKETAQNPRLFAKLLEQEKVTVLNQVPGVFNNVVQEVLSGAEDYDLSLRYVIFGGEALNPASLSRWYERFPQTRLINMYGITETTVHTTYKEIGIKEIKAGDSNIGKAIPTVELYLSDKNGNLVPEGIVGEILVGGLGVARGYLNRPELTTERFINNPWKRGERLYRSGDLGRRLPTGELVYMGRGDFQVKIRGYRIELGEIEDALLRYEGVRDAVVLAKPDGNGEQYLVGYYVIKEGAAVEQSMLRTWLQQRLPGYMIPSCLMELAFFPLTSNGKIDRKALPAPEEKGNASSTSYVEAITPLEKQLVVIWQKTLGREKIGIRDDFFELGGNSLSAARLMTHIFRELHVKLNLRSVFNRPVIEQLALEIQHIMKQDGVQEADIRTELTPFQQYLWMLELVNENTRANNIYITCDVQQPIDLSQLNTALSKLSERHAILRTKFLSVNGKLEQCIYSPEHITPQEVEYTDLRNNAGEDEVEKAVQEIVNQPLPLEGNSLFRLHVIQLTDDSYKFIVTAHAIIADQQSVNILLHELLAISQAGDTDISLPQLNQYTVAETWNKNSKVANRSYWINRFENGFPGLELLVDNTNKRYEFQRDHHSLSLSPDVSKKLYRFGTKENTDIFATVLTALNALIYRYTYQDEFVLGTVIRANNGHDTDRLLVGPYEYSLPLVQKVKDHDTFKTLLHRTQLAIEEAMQHRYPFEDVVDTIGRNLAQSCKLGVMVTLNNDDNQWISSKYTGLNLSSVKNINTDSTANIANLSFNFFENGETVGLVIEYNSRLINKNSIERLASHFEQICDLLADQNEDLIIKLDYLLPGEKDLLHNTFNSAASLERNNTVIDLFEKQVQDSPASVAIVHGETKLTYEELNTRVNQLANYLCFEQNVKTEELVGVLLDKSTGNLLSLLGIMKSGGAYLPIDTALPVSRIKEIINDAGIRTIISEKKFIDVLNFLQWECPLFNSFLCLDSYQVNRELSGPYPSTGKGTSVYTKEEAEASAQNIVHKLSPHLNGQQAILEISNGGPIFEKVFDGHTASYSNMSSDALTNLPDESTENTQQFDIVIINAGTCLFYSHNHLRDIIHRATRLISNQGFILICDIMDLDARERLGGSVDMPGSSTGLFIAKAFLLDLVSEIAHVKDVSCTPTLRSTNEISRYQFDALLRINKEQQHHPILRRKVKCQDDLTVLDGYNADKPSARVDTNNLAYCIYTSGSTGKPKGVLIDHSNLVHTLEAENALHGLDHNMTSCFSTNYAFDVSLLEMLLPLINGGTVVIPEQEKLLDEGYLPQLMEETDVTDLQGTPTFISSFLVQPLLRQVNGNRLQLHSLRRLWIGGESLSESLVKELKGRLPGTEINNHYGPTEITVDCTAFKNVNQFERNSIGKPLSHAKVYITDSNMQLMPVGLAGEICIGGKGVARGYLNDLPLSERKFVPDPFNPGNRLYRTGDFGYWNEDGNIIFIGRKDQQLKIRGHRIETGEIEQVLLKYPKIKDAVILVNENGTEKELVACIETNRVNGPELWPSAGEYPVYDDLLYQVMADDEIRNRLYRDVIRREVRGKTVLEIGPGAELVLTLMCIEAGAKKVYAIEWMEESYKKALQKIKKLGLEDKIILTHGDALETEIPADVDMCVSEQIGSIGSSEGAIRLNNYPRKFLQKHSPVIPAKCVTAIAAVDLPVAIASLPVNEVAVHYAQKIFDAIGYEFDLRMLVKNMDESCLVSNSGVFEELDFTKDIPEEDYRTIELTIARDGHVSGFIAWVQLFVDGEEYLDALKQPVNWLPVYFPVFDTEVPVVKGDRILATIQRKISEDGFHPDYCITGELIREGQEIIPFVHHSCYSRNRKKHNRFYKDLFETGLAGAEGMKEEIRNYLRSQLPPYMLPSRLVLMDKFPVTASGKIDRVALTKNTTTVKTTNALFAAPGNETEKAIAALWQEALQIEDAGIHDNFFDVGGHSIKAARLCSLIFNQFGTRINLKTVFDHPTIAQLAAIVNETEQLKHRSIDPLEEQEYYTVSHAQKRMWILDQIEKDGIAAYNMPFVWEMEGLDITVMEKTFHLMMERHESLRTTFLTVNSEPKQRIRLAHETGFKINYIDLRNEAEKEKIARKLVNAENTTPFDLKEGPLLRASLLQMTDTRQIFTLTLQHTVGDAWSMEVFENDFKTLYNSIKEEQEHGLQPLKVQYRDYAAWQKKYLDEPAGKSDHTYWMEQFKKKPQVLQLPVEFPRPRVKTYNGNIAGVLLGSTYTQQLQALSQELRVSVTMILMASVKALLYKYSNQEDITIGSPIIGRDTVELEKQIGFYTNTLAIRTNFDARKSFRELVFQVRENILNGFDHQLYPFDQLVEDLQLQRDLSRSPLFDVMMIHHNVGSGKKQTEFDTVEVGKYLKEVQQSKFDLTFNFTDAGDKILFGINYNTDLFSKERIEQMMRHYEELLAHALSDSTVAVSKLKYLTTAEIKQLVEDFNDTKVTYAEDKLIHELFETQAAIIPDNIAIKCEDRWFTFGELNERSNKLAHYLRAVYAVKPDDLFGVMINRNEWLPVILLGILKAGAGYVPVDPNYPKLRNEVILDDADVRAVITEESIISSEEYGSLADNMSTVIIDTQWEEISTYPHTNPARINSVNDIFYIIYTSGSTGKPKGVVHTHRTIGSFIGWSRDEYKNSRFDITYFSTSLCFDMSVYEIFYTLGIGKPIRVVNNGFEIGNWLNEDNNILVNTVPSVVQTLLNENTDLGNISVLNMAGEPVPYAVKEALDKEQMEVVNGYGPSEYASLSTFYRLTPDRKKILIGKPLGNTQIFILDDHLGLVPVGVKGEIYIAGEGISPGYLNRPELTNEKFIDHPFENGKKIYKSGDVGMWDADGNIEFFGRRDYQVKIRGQRVEMGEIEAVLTQFEGIQQAVADVQKTATGHDALVAYYSGEEVNLALLKKFLGERLPAHMVPTHILYVPAFPLTPNGKVDRKQLAPVDIQQALLATYEAPRNEVEQKLVSIWHNLFATERIGIRDSFFDIGGNSLLAMRLVSAIRKELDVEMPIRTVFTHLTIAGLAEYIDQTLTDCPVEADDYEEIKL